MKQNKPLFLIIILFLICLYVAVPRNFNIFGKQFHIPGINLNIGSFSFKRDLLTKFGLDIAGGSRIVFEADMSKVLPVDKNIALSVATETVSRRVNLFGVSEPVVTSSKVGDNFRVNVELPGVTDITEAVSLIGKTAQLVFGEIKEEKIEGQATPSAKLVLTNLTGSDLVKAQIEFDPKTGKPVVGLTFNDKGAKKFEKITEANIGHPLAILIDGQFISNPPIVQEKISGGKAVITGNFTTEEVKHYVIQLNSGALPVPLKVVEQRTVGPTLGRESVAFSIRAGLVGIAAIALFMIFYYGRLGIVATIALFMYTVFALAIFKLVPIVLTLPGITGFLLSVAVAVDSNILTFERFKEELRRGLSWHDALEVGFGRAWDSIRDANIATLIIGFILFNPLNWPFLLTSGPIRGFAVTLIIGVILSLFTGIVVTRTLLRILARK